MGSPDCKLLTLGGLCGHPLVKQAEESTPCAELVGLYACPACSCGEPCDSLGTEACRRCHEEMSLARRVERAVRK